jgi:hypothetical protein
MIEQFMLKNNLSHRELIDHWEAFQHLSNTTSQVKLKLIDRETKERIGKLYKELRRLGIYPVKPSGEKMTFVERETKEIPYSPEVERIPKKDCAFGDCKNCRVIIYPEKSNCEIRTREWMKGINNILSVSKRAPGEGVKMSFELIDYMQNDFMGGVK